MSWGMVRSRERERRWGMDMRILAVESLNARTLSTWQHSLVCG
jgi:hypothetical protein